ncbi:MAG: hypothetical protein AAGA03_13070, partial [Planctomycetota bacterium]
MLLTVAAGSAIAGTGCRKLVPIQTWRPSVIESTVGKRVAVSPLLGDPQVTSPLMEGLLSASPRDPGRQLTLVPTSTLQLAETIRMVSAVESEVSDVTLASIANRQGFDYLLQGELFEDRRPEFLSKDDPRLSVSWRLTDLRDKRSAGGHPVTVTPE